MEPSLFLQSRRALAGWLLCLLLGCTAERDAPLAREDAKAPTLVAQRVTATVKKEAATLLRIETDGETIVTTPEHPFATPEAGWTPAGQLAPGDRVVSARFGTTRVVSALRETRESLVPVFNLTVAGSHSYLVGADQVLVHNTRCNDTRHLLDRKTEELRQAQSELDALKASGASSSRQNPEDTKKIAELEERIRKLRTSIANARARLRRAGVDPDSAPTDDSAPIGDPIARRVQQVEKLDADIAKLQGELPSSRDKAETERRIQKLLAERKSAMHALAALKRAKRKRTGEEPPSEIPTTGVKRTRMIDEVALDARRLQRASKQHESAKKALEATRQELRELETRRPRTEDERKAAATRKAELEKLLAKQEHDYEAANRILTWEKEVATINETQKTSGKRPDLEARRKKLRAEISAENTRTYVRHHGRKKRAEPGYDPSKRADHGRLPETVERMKEELSELRQQPDSPTRAERITHLENAIKKATELIETIRKIKNLGVALSRARKKHDERSKKGEDTSAVDRTIGQLEHDVALQRAERTRLRAEALLLGLVQAQRRKPLDDQDAAFVQEIENMLADPATMDEQRLTQTAHETEDTVRGEADALDDTFFDEVFRDGNEARDGARQEAVPEEFESLDEELQAIIHSLMEPEPEAVAGPGSPGQRTASPGDPRDAGPSSDPAERNARLRMEWKRRIEERLKDARDQLQLMQKLERYRDESIEADLRWDIAFLEENLQNPPF